MLTILYRLSVYLYKDVVFSNINGMRPLYYNFFLRTFSCLHTSKAHNLHAGCKVCITKLLKILIKKLCFTITEKTLST